MCKIVIVLLIKRQIAGCNIPLRLSRRYSTFNNSGDKRKLNPAEDLYNEQVIKCKH